MLFGKKNRQPEGKTAWAQVPLGNVPELASALTRVVSNAKMQGVDPAKIVMGPLRRTRNGRGEEVWDLSFRVSDEAWALRGYPTDQVSESELRTMTAQEISAALKAGRLQSLFL